MPNNATLDRLEAWQAQMIPFLEAQKPQVTGLPNHRLGCHWICDQYRRSDVDYFRALGPLAALKLVNPSRDRVVEAFSCIDQYGHVALRYHPISEQQAELAQNPAGLGIAHAQYWINQLNITYKEFDRSRICVMGINEPSIHNAAEATRVAVYTENFLRTLQPHGIRAYVFNFSVGWPREEAGRIIWDEFRYLVPLINLTKSFGCVHRYWYPTLLSGWDDYADRISNCPLEIPFVIGECGYTRQLADLPQPWGWDGNITAPTYAQMLWDYADKVDPGKVFAVLPFTTSFGGEEWRNKDTAKAHADILARKHNFVWPNPWPQYTTPPVDPPTEGDPMLIIVPKYTGRINGFYGQLYQNDAGAYYPHEGLDIAYPLRTPIYAPADGVIAWDDYRGAEKSAYGIYCRSSHPQFEKPFCMFFGHMAECVVRKDDVVKQGQLLGYSGNSGNSSGAHLHWEVRIMTASGGYQVDKVLPATLQNLYRQNGRTDPLAWLRGWEAAGGKVEER